MNKKVLDLINEAYDIAHENNKSGHNRSMYTFDEANRYDPLISTLHKLKREALK